jgi:hypothetical protein
MLSITEQVSARLAIGVCFAVLGSGCGGGRPLTPSAPSPVASARTSPTSNAATYTITGVVADESGQPIEAANVNAWVATAGIGYSYMAYRGAPLLTDGDGRYQMTELPADAGVWFQVYKAGYVQQCAARATVQGDLAIDLALISETNLTTTPQSAPGLRSVSGTVVEITEAGKQPVAGAFVDFEPLEDFVAAKTYSDQAGRFALCGLPADAAVQLGASSDQRVAYVSVTQGQTTDVEIVVR